MSLRFIFFALIFSQTTLAGTKACGGAQVGYWTNPDGSRGGMVASTAKAFTGAFIAPEAQVCDYAQIHKDAKLLERATLAGRAQLLPGGEVGGSARVEGEAKIGGSVNIPTKISGEVVVSGSPLITGRTSITQKAKVSGSAKVHNSIICQASLIEGIEVIESDYYCQTDDPEPPHPGEAGTKTLLGVDVDRDGVRDDIEIWINQKFSNTVEKDLKLMRMEVKQFAIYKQLMMKNNRNKSELQKLDGLSEGSIVCMSEVFQDEFIKILKEFQSNLMNTTERTRVYLKLQNLLPSTSSPEKSKKGKELCIYLR